MCIRVLTIFKCACPHRNTLVCPHHIHVREPSSTANLSSQPSPPNPSKPDTTSSSPPSAESPETNNTTDGDMDDDFQKGFTPRLPSALQGHKAWTPLPGKENQRWEHCPGYLAKCRALAVASAGSKTGEVIVGKETQCAEYKATEPKFRRRWEVKAGLCEECRGMHGMDGPSGGQDGEKGKEGGKGKERGVGKGMREKKEEERGRARARSRAATDPTPTVGAVVPVPGLVDGGGNVVKGVSAKVVGRRVVRKRIATL
ncbi:hypothetical protein B0H65DRAFT_578438 [Neurospora tetraspora]|uniref:Uncharacterized protein n=1 Tax=Neurospora tetraspora TaxID=94610 RepID=A0AAE0MQA4_9PEZI|nr:hypothetical protein B0H65DRAFT_578438 [Neurospora tetraspora]